MEDNKNVEKNDADTPCESNLKKCCKEKEHLSEKKDCQKDEKINILQKEKDELNDKFMRLNAEFVNFKNRLEKEKIELLKYASFSTLEMLLPFLDTFDSAIKCEHKSLDECKKGFKLVYDSLFDILKKEGLEVIKAEGEKFNPEFHEAIGFDNNDKFDNDICTIELQKGYKLKDKILRHSMVKVNKKG